MSERIAIIGAGPAGCALACMLVERNIDCLVFDDNNKPSLLVGESLIPAAMPIIRRLGIEQEIAKFSRRKEGAALRYGDIRANFNFQQTGKDIPSYAYNIPRPKFDQTVRKRAEELGVHFVSEKAELEACDSDPNREIRLSDKSLAAAGLKRETQPDFLIDATGRSRLFSKILNIKATKGPRNDVAHFAHFKNFDSDSKLDGQIVISVLNCGWSWQIPLKDRTSVGVVMNSRSMSQYGGTAEQRLENVLRENEFLNKPNFERLTEVKTYANYQLMAEQGHGTGWALLGDALGFVDPMLSPGVFMALESANQLDKMVFSQPQEQREAGLNQRYKDAQNWHQAWSTLIEYFYDGRMLALAERQPQFTEKSAKISFARFADRVVNNILSQLVSGGGTRSKFYQGALFRICGLMGCDADKLAEYRIKDQPKTQLPIDLNKAARSITKKVA